MSLSKFLSLLLLPTALAFTHPGLLVTDTDLARAQKHITAKQDPWLSSWNKLTSLPLASADYTNNAVSSVSRNTAGEGDVANAELLWHDAAAAFNLALRWRISGDESFAATAAKVLTAWADKLQHLGGKDEAYLLAGLQGYELANAAELLRDYSPFAQDGLRQVTQMMTSIFLPMNIDFLNHVLPSEHNVKHFFANWELASVASAMAVAVLADNQTAWDFAVDYFKNGSGNGAINNAVTNIVAEPGTGKPLGQGQESGRDQGHSALDWQLLGAIGQQAWNQGEDLFGYNESRILLGAEYFARYNLGNDVPFEPYTNGIVSYTKISAASRGAIRPTWELLHNHYVRVKGVEAPWTTAYLNKSLDYFGGFEGGAGSWGEGSGHYDGLGWGSLLYRMDDADLVESLSSSTTASLSQATSLSASATAQSLVISSTSAVASSAPVETHNAEPPTTSIRDIPHPATTTLVRVTKSSAMTAPAAPTTEAEEADGPSCGVPRRN